MDYPASARSTGATVSICLALIFPLGGLLISGCDGGDPGLSCGPGTVQEDNRCVVPPPSGSDGGVSSFADAGQPSSSSDAGARPTPTPTSDAGPPAPRPDGSVPVGCDVASGQCQTWAAQLRAQLESHPGRCTSPLPASSVLTDVAERHATHQASIDRLTSESPGGSIFDQVRSGGYTYSAVGVLFASTHRGPYDVIDRWAGDTGAQEQLTDCWVDVGVGFSTSTTGVSYVTVIFARPQG